MVGRSRNASSGKKPTLSFKSLVKKYSSIVQAMREEIQKMIIGQRDVIDGVLTCLVSDGHALLEGVPGLAKTYLIMTLSETVKGSVFHRIQFTPDLLPSDIVGVTIYNPEKGFYTEKGPVFANFVLADEINRAPPKVQSAMLQAMQERQVTIGKTTFDLPKPFLTLATQNPLEQMGTYPLPEAQVDRFLFKIYVDYPKREEEIRIIDENMDTKRKKGSKVRAVASLKDILKIQEIAREVYISDQIKRYIVDIVFATREATKLGIRYGKYIEWGASPRASINLANASRSWAFLNGRSYVIPDDVKSIVHNVLRHRIILNYEGKAMGISSDQVVDEILKKVDVP